MKTQALLVFLLSCLPMLTTAANVVDERLQSYQSAGAKNFDATAGQLLWARQYEQADGSKARACSSCHTSDLRQAGKQINTGKTIEPMSLAVNSQRLTDADKIEKWFGRNCKWTMNRECSAQEKGNFLKFILSQ